MVQSSFPQKAQKKPESKAKFIPILIEIETSKNVFNTDQPLGKKGLCKKGLGKIKVKLKVKTDFLTDFETGFG